MRRVRLSHPERARLVTAGVYVLFLFFIIFYGLHFPRFAARHKAMAVIGRFGAIACFFGVMYDVLGTYEKWLLTNSGHASTSSVLCNITLDIYPTPLFCTVLICRN